MDVIFPIFGIMTLIFMVICVYYSYKFIVIFLKKIYKTKKLLFYFFVLYIIVIIAFIICSILE